MLQAGLPFLEALGALVAIIAILTLVAAVLHTIRAVRSSDSRLESRQFGTAKGRIDHPTSHTSSSRLANLFDTNPRLS
jgi:hypothetical protein